MKRSLLRVCFCIILLALIAEAATLVQFTMTDIPIAIAAIPSICIKGVCLRWLYHEIR